MAMGSFSCREKVRMRGSKNGVTHDAYNWKLRYGLEECNSGTVEDLEQEKKQI